MFSDVMFKRPLHIVDKSISVGIKANTQIALQWLMFVYTLYIEFVIWNFLMKQTLERISSQALMRPAVRTGFR
jgi:hypothetical protein